MVRDPLKVYYAWRAEQHVVYDAARDCMRRWLRYGGMRKWFETESKVPVKHGAAAKAKVDTIRS